jgi:hypothetical protein
MILQCIAKQPLLCPVIKVVIPNHGFKFYGSRYSSKKTSITYDITMSLGRSLQYANKQVLIYEGLKIMLSGSLTKIVKRR